MKNYSKGRLIMEDFIEVLKVFVIWTACGFGYLVLTLFLMFSTLVIGKLCFSEQMDKLLAFIKNNE